MSDDENWVDRAKSMAFVESPQVSLKDGGIIIVAAPDDAVAGDICLQIGIGTAEQPACVVATSVAPELLESYISDRAPTQPALGFVDATPNRPTPAMKESVQALEDIPSSRDLLQLTTAVGDVREAIAPNDQPVNIVIPTFGSLLSAAPTDRVVRVLSHIAESNESDGRVVIGLNYTAGSNETFQTLKDHSDVILWAERDGDGTVRLDSESL